jgi:predicted nucleic acid-binding Zn ribbon protein
MQPTEPEGPVTRGGFPVRLADVLPGALERLGPRGLWTEARLRRAWAEAVGADIASNATVVRLRGTVVEVRARSETWATQLRYLSSVVIGRLNAVLGPGTVTEIAVRRAREPRSQGRS